MDAASLPNVYTHETSKAAHTSTHDSRGESMITHDPVNIDQMLVWVARRGYSEIAIGYATRRIAQLGTMEQLVAFTTAVRDKVRNLSQESHSPGSRE
jgi:hypothetical protein